MQSDVANLLYLLASVLFIFGLKGLTHPRRAVKGNLISALGMFIAVATALVSEAGLDWRVIACGVVVGSAVGTFLALKTRMTAIP